MGKWQRPSKVSVTPLLTTYPEFFQTIAVYLSSRPVREDETVTAVLSQTERDAIVALLRTFAETDDEGLAEELEKSAEEHGRYNTPVDVNLLRRTALRLRATRE